MVKPISDQFHEALNLALQLSPSERMAMIGELAASFRSEFEGLGDTASDDEPFTPNEIVDLLTIAPLPPDEVAAQGRLGTWGDMGITDGAEWVNAQKHKRKERRKWSAP